MAGEIIDSKIVLGIDQAASKKLIEKDLKKLLSQIRDLEVQIKRIKLDKKAISELEDGLRSLGQTSQKLANGQKGLFDVKSLSSGFDSLKKYASAANDISNVLGNKDSESSLQKINQLIQAIPNAPRLQAIVSLITTIGTLLNHVYDTLVLTTEEAETALNSSLQELQQVNTEIGSIQSQLTETGNRIDELNAKDHLSLVELDELSKLREQNSELERELSIQEDLLQVKNEQARTDAVNYFNSTKTDTPDYIDSVHTIDAIEEEIEKSANLYKLLEEQKLYEEGSSQWSQLQSEINKIADNRDDYKKDIESALIDFMKYDDSLVEGKDDELIARLNRIYQLYDQTFQPERINQEKIQGILGKSQFKEMESALIDLSNSGALSIDILSSRFPELIDYLEKAGITANELLTYINALSDSPVSSYDTLKQELRNDYVNQYAEHDDRTYAGHDFDRWIAGKSDNDLQILYRIKYDDTSSYGWSFEDFDAEIERRQNEPLVIDSGLNQLTDSLQVLNDLQSRLNTLDSAVINYHENGSFSLDDLAAISDYFLSLGDFDTSAVDNALSVLSDSSSTTEELTRAIGTVADQYLQASGILDTVTDRNKALIISQLESMGISNAQEIVNAKLAASYGTLVQAEAVAAQYSINLSTVTYDEINSLLTEGQISEITARQLAYYAIQKQYCNGAVISTVADCQNMINLAKTAGYSTEVLSRLEALKARMSSSDYIFSETVRNNVANQINNILSEAGAHMADYDIEIPQATYNGGFGIANALNDAGQAAKASAQAVEDTYEELFDFLERRAEVLNDALDLLNTNLENVFGSSAKNQLIDAQINISKESINNQTDALAMYQQKASEALAKIPAESQSKVTEGSVSLIDFIGSGNKDVVEAIKDYQNWADKVAECKQELGSLKKELRQLELDKFNHIVSDFTSRFDISSDAQDLIKKQIDLFEEAGQLIGEGFYQGLIKESEGQLAVLEQEKQSLADELAFGLDNGLIEKGSEEWLEIVDAFNNVDNAILNCKKDIEEFNNAIQNLHWDMVKRIQENFDNLSDEIKNLTGLIDDADISDAKGNWSKEGLTLLGLYAQQYERAIYSANMYEEEIANLNEAFANGEYSATEYADKLADLKKAQWEEINASEAAKDSLISLNKERVETMVTAIEDEIDAMKELISSKKNALDAEEELYEYRRSVSEKTRSVTDIERQIAAMQNDDTASTVAKRKKLEEQLAQAKEELADYEYSHSIDTQKSALDQQFEAFETDKESEIEQLRATLNDREAVIAASFETVKSNAQLIGSEIISIAQSHGIIVSESITTAWASGENAVASYGEALGIGASTFLANMGNMVQNIYGLQSQADAAALSLANMYNQNSENLQNSLIASWYSAANLNAVAQALDASLINALGRGYDVSSLVNGMNSIGNAAANAARQVRDFRGALGGIGKAGVPTYQNVYQGVKSDGSDSIVRLPDGTMTTKDKAQSAGYVNKYAKGGLVTKDTDNPLNYIARSVGEDTLIAAKDGELVLTPAEADAFLKLAPNMELFNSLLPKMETENLTNNIPFVGKTPPSVQIHYDNLVQVQGDVNNSNIREMKAIVNDAITKQFHKFNTDLYKAGVR